MPYTKDELVDLVNSSIAKFGETVPKEHYAEYLSGCWSFITGSLNGGMPTFCEEDEDF